MSVGCSVSRKGSDVPLCLREDSDAERAPLSLLELPVELLSLVFSELDVRSLARVAGACSVLYGGEFWSVTPVEYVLRQRITEHGRVHQPLLPVGYTAWSVFLAWLEQRRDEARAHVAAAWFSSLLLTCSGQLFECGIVAIVSDAPYFADVDYAVQLPGPVAAMMSVRIAGVSVGQDEDAGR